MIRQIGFSHFLIRLSTLTREAQSERSQAQIESSIQEISDIGAQLFAAWFPEELKREYSKIREKYRGNTLMITSDAHWLPWELFRPSYADAAGSLSTMTSSSASAFS